LTYFILKVTPKCNFAKEDTMRFSGIKELEQKTMDILKESKKEDIIATAYSKPMAVLHHLTEDDLADDLIENDPTFKSRIEEAFVEYSDHGGVTVDAMIKRDWKDAVKVKKCKVIFSPRAQHEIEGFEVNVALQLARDIKSYLETSPLHH
jgi:hypothetical protein